MGSGLRQSQSAVDGAEVTQPPAPPPAALARPSWGGLAGGAWFVVCGSLSLLRGARVRISLPGDGGAVCRVPSVLWLLLLAQIYIPFPRFTPQGAGRF